MEHAERVGIELGENNVNVLIEEIRTGKMNKHKLKMIALQMGGGAHGVFEKNKDRLDLELVDLMKLLLDQWYKDSLHSKDFNGFGELMRILINPEVGLNYLTKEMKIETTKMGVGISVKNICQERNKGLNGNQKTGGVQNQGYQTVVITDPDATDKLLYKNQRLTNKNNSDHDQCKLLKHGKDWLPVYIPILTLWVGILIGRISTNFAPETTKLQLLDENLFGTTAGDTISDVKHEVTPCISVESKHSNNLTNPLTRSFTVKVGKFKEFHGCHSNQSQIPDLPNKLVDVVGIYTDEFGLLVCGGLDVGYNQSADHQTQCYNHIIGSKGWESFKHGLNTNRRGSHMKMIMNKLHIIGGRSSDPRHDCYPSREVLDLDNVSDGWKQEESVGECFTDQVIEVPCI